MRGQLAATAWEIEAARRQEVVASDFLADRPPRADGGSQSGRRAVSSGRGEGNQAWGMIVRFFAPAPSTASRRDTR